MSSLNYLLRVHLGSSAQEVSTSNTSSTALLTGITGGSAASSTAALLKMSVEDTNKLKKQVRSPCPTFIYLYLFIQYYHHIRNSGLIHLSPSNLFRLLWCVRN